MARKVQVIKIDAARIDSGDTPSRNALETTKAALRSLRSFGIRFSTEEVDGQDVTVSAWIAETEPRVKKERKALGSAIPENSVGLSA